MKLKLMMFTIVIGVWIASVAHSVSVSIVLVSVGHIRTVVALVTNLVSSVSKSIRVLLTRIRNPWAVILKDDIVVRLTIRVK